MVRKYHIQVADEVRRGLVECFEGSTLALVLRKL